VWKEGQYLTHDAVTSGGNLWIARCDTTSKPADNNSDWQLAVRKGRDGKDGEAGKQGPVGPAGKDGRDLTKW
jgi:integrin beta 3